MARSILWVILHHAYSVDKQKSFDYWGIHDYHVEDLGWSDVGYNEIFEYVNGRPISIVGRPITQRGAHAKGFNHNSVGLCLSGEHDSKGIGEGMEKLLVKRIKVYQQMFEIPAKRVIGHWETFIHLGKVKTKEEAWDKYKTCPGRMIDMDKLRKKLV